MPQTSLRRLLALLISAASLAVSAPGAIYFMTPLSLDYVLAELTTMLEAAAEGEAPQSYPG